MKRITVLLAMAVFFLPQIDAQKKVLGTVEYAYKVVGEGAEAMAAMMPTKMIMQYGENGMTMIMEGGMMASMLGKTVVNGETGEVFMVKDADKTVFLMSDEEIESNASQADKTKLEKQEGSKEILGYTCNKYIVTTEVQGNNMKQILWVTDELRSPDYEGKAFKGMSNNNMSFDVDGFPLMIEIDVPGMPVKMELQVTDIKFGKIDKSEFARPEGYEVKPFSSMMGF